ncbi:hypothetical protein B9Y66_02810 [Stenotrophomonas maltophilia]|nr:hypothetical protein B9Y66_02810 [Stenotrophomonas maltophilia]
MVDFGQRITGGLAMNVENQRVTVEFVVLHDGVSAALRLDHGIAGWGILLRALHDPMVGDEIHVGRIVGSRETIDEAHKAGTVAAIQAIVHFRGQSTEDVRFALRARAIQQAGGQGSFASVVEVVSGLGEVTDRMFVPVHGAEFLSADEALATARDALRFVDGLTDQGKFIR